jgi:putative PIN family toxin of toxin-antitoxin system
MRLVLSDTSLWISAIQFRGLPLEALRYSISRDTLLTCFELEDEIVRVLSQKFGHPESNVRAQLQVMLENAVRVSISGSVSGICRDPNDDFILECAATGNADLIVTGDKDLLSLKAYGTIPILTPRQYLDEAADRRRRDT